MRAIASLATGAALLLASCATTPAPRANSEDELAKAIAGRVAGEPVDCIYLQKIDSSRIIDRLAIVYKMRDGTIYVNRPAGASSLQRDDIMVTDTHSGQLCSIDIVRMQDSTTRFETGSLGLGKFVPYPRADRRPS